MKQKRSIGKAVLSFCLAIMFVLQTVALSPAAYADSSSGDSGTEAVSESGSSNADEPSVTEAVYDAPNNFVAPMDKTAVFLEANSTFPLVVTQGDNVVAPNTGTIVGRQQFTLKSEGLKVPVKGDYANTPDENDTTKYIQKGDSI